MGEGVGAEVLGVSVEARRTASSLRLRMWHEELDCFGTGSARACLCFPAVLCKRYGGSFVTPFVRCSSIAFLAYRE